MASTTAPPATPAAHPLTQAEQLTLLILRDLSQPRAHHARGPSQVAARLGRDRATVSAAMTELEREQMLIRWMGVRPSEAGYHRLRDLQRRT